MRYNDRSFGGMLALGWLVVTISACVPERYQVVAPNYDHLIGRKFSESIVVGRSVFKVVRATDTIEEFERRRADGCILVFGVRKKDDVIEYWRVDSGPGTCTGLKGNVNP